MAEGVVVHLCEPVQQAWLLGQAVGHQEGNKCLTVWPPQFHAPLQLQDIEPLWVTMATALGGAQWSKLL